MTELLGSEMSASVRSIGAICSFCGNTEDLAGPMIGGENAHICEHCVDACNDLLQEDRKRRLHRMLHRLPRPRTLRAHLDRHVVGQDHAKKTLAVAVYNHYKRLLWRTRDESPELGKSNILLTGPSGSGKSHLAESLARALDVPFVSVDATRLTAAGYAGDDVDAIVRRLLSVCDHDGERAERGIVYLDEVDKLAARAAGGSSVRDVSGEGAQQALLQLLDGCSVTVEAPSRRHARVTVDTRDVLFICGGTFDGLEKVQAERERPQGMGFTAAVEGVRESADRPPAAADLERFGLIPELIGRLPVLTRLEAMDEDALMRVLTEPDGALIRQYQEMLRRDGCELVFTDAAVRGVARRALERGTGARALRSVLEDVLLEAMYTVPASHGEVRRLVVDEEAVRGGSPIYEMTETRRQVG